MKSFPELAADLFADYGESITVDRLNETDLRRLCAAYVRDDPSILDDIFAGIKNESISEHVATLIEHVDRAEALKHCDVFDLAKEIRGAAFPDKDLLSLVQGELDRLWRLRRRTCGTAAYA